MMAVKNLKLSIATIALSMLISANFSAIACAQDSALKLKANPTISGDQITIGDIFENAGAKANQIIARAPAAGQNTIFAAPSLQSRMASMGLLWRNNESVRQIIVRGAPSNKPQFGAAPNYGTPAAQNTAQISNRVISNTGENQNIQIAVLSREVNKDEIIGAHMVTWVNAPENMGRDTIIDAESLIGTVAKRKIQAGAPVRNSDVGMALAVRRGQPVTLIHEAGGLKISLRGRALSDGVIGGSIRAVNVATNKPLEAIVESDGVARVLLPASSAQVSTNRQFGAQITGF